MHDSPRILSTKKLHPHQKSLLIHAGFRVIEADFISIEHHHPEPIDVKEHLIFTSTNAVKSVLNHPENKALKGKTCFCVGKKTKALLEQNHFRVAIHTDYAYELASEIIKNHSGLGFTFFCGNLRRGDLPDTLAAHHIDFNETVVYITRLTPHEIKTPVAGILFFSPSGVRSYLEKNRLKEEICFCIGTTTANALKGITENIVLAHTPGVENTIASAAKYFKRI